MYAWNSLVVFIASLLEQVLQIYFWVVIISAALSWIEPNPYNPIVRAIYGITEPVFDWVRGRLPVFFGGIDFSPLVVLFVIWFLQGWLIPTLVHAILVGGFA